MAFTLLVAAVAKVKALDCVAVGWQQASGFAITMLDYGDEFVCAESFGTRESKVLKLFLIQHNMIKQQVLPPHSGPHQYGTYVGKGASGIRLKECADAWWASLACLLPEIRPRTDDMCSQRTDQRALCSVHS